MSGVTVVTGAGGVGKTTLAAATAVGAARRGESALVLTVDPARRLADALGLEELGNDPEPVPGESNLWAAMLDVTASWEAMVNQHAEPDVADRLLANPYFRAIADRFPAAQSYAAGEEMSRYIESGRWDVIVVDTPPSAGGIDFFEAPANMRNLIGGRLLRWITGARLPGRKALYRIAARPALRLADSVLGGPLLEEIADFFIDLRTLHDGIAARARHVERHLAEATIVVVTTSDPTPLREAHRFFGSIEAPDLVVFNRALPDDWADAGPSGFEGKLGMVADKAMEVWGTEAHKGSRVRAEFSDRYGVRVVAVPWMPTPPTDTDSLEELGRALTP
ncbi:MAG: AAA family ATPase [Acidimicrobiia bacterium]|nr:AAA family ATPase [Acidimicrobiia bacterium]NNF68770.1 ArsA family ATPase [Acidimicrobiia bacterium]